jgi:hypothetical protein
MTHKRALDEPHPKTRAKAFALLFGGFGCAVSIVIFLTGDVVDHIDWLFIVGFPIVFSVLAYFIGLHVSDDADGA